VDVPGHERFVRTMVAGASGIDMFLLCVAADDGVMPQTREHLAVLRQLGVERGVVAITKADAADPTAASAEAAELVPEAESIAVSALEGTGLDELLAGIERVTAGLPGRGGDGGPPRLHVDRSFTLRGIGTVVTGTLWSGALSAGDVVRVLPAGHEARVRSVQVHDRPVERAEAGQRVALNLAGVGWRELGRGDVVASPGSGLAPAWLVDATMSLEPGARPLGRSTRLHVHHGTREAPARVVPLGGGYAQLRLESPLVPAPGDRLVLRQLAPPDTVGGGVVIDAHPRKHGASEAVVERLRALERGERPRETKAPSPPPAPASSAPPTLDEAALRLEAELRADGPAPRTDTELAAAVGLDASAASERFRALERAGRAVRVGRSQHYAREPLAQLTERIVAICERDGQATIAGVRDELGTSRKYAQALLEHLDAEKVTRRLGDAHVLRRR
ncbi:MAG: SelB C-terminal domain-containing protein, partial [Thermoleophilaceae bacterium]